MQSDLFLSRQRKPRNRQLRKPLVVQVRARSLSIHQFWAWLGGRRVFLSVFLFGHFFLVHSEHCCPELQETLLNTSAPSPSSPTPLPQVLLRWQDRTIEYVVSWGWKCLGRSFTVCINEITAKNDFSFSARPSGNCLLSHFLFLPSGTGSFRPIHPRLAPSSRSVQTKTTPATSSSAGASQLSSMDFFCYLLHFSVLLKYW